MTRAILGGILIGLALPASTLAQPPPGPPPNARCTTLAALGGVSAAAGDTGILIGAASEWALTRRVSLQGKAGWFDRGPGSDFFSATINVVGVVAQVERTEAFVKAGLGVLAASLDTSRGAPPSFYGRRIGSASPGQRSDFDFTDPAAAIGAGFAVQLNRSFSLRPEVETLIAWRQSHAFTATSVALHLAYHFERHIVTPNRRAR